MARDNITKYRGFPSLTPEVHKELIHALSVGAPIALACEAAGIVNNTFYRWMRPGKALHLGEAMALLSQERLIGIYERPPNHIRTT